MIGVSSLKSIVSRTSFMKNFAARSRSRRRDSTHEVKHPVLASLHCRTQVSAVQHFCSKCSSQPASVEACSESNGICEIFVIPLNPTWNTGKRSATPLFRCSSQPASAEACFMGNDVEQVYSGLSVGHFWLKIVSQKRDSRKMY